MVHSNTDPTGVGGDVVDAIRHRPAEFLDQKIMHANRLGIALWTPLPPGVPEVAYKFLLFRVNRDHRLLCRQRRRHALVDMDKLRVAVGMIAALLGLGVTLQTEPLSLE
jgi:hypothetical protein